MKYLLTVLIVILGLFQFANCETPIIPYSYLEYTPDGQYVFVMIAPNEKNDGYGLSPQKRTEALQIREKYGASGLYHNNDSKIPIWKVDWYSLRVLVSSYGDYVVRLGALTNNASDEAFSIFTKNQHKQTYKVEELVDFTWLLPDSHFYLHWKSDLSLNNVEKTLEVKTLTYDTFIIDLESGEVLNSSRPIRYLLGLISLLCITMIILILRFIINRQRNIVNI